MTTPDTNDTILPSAAKTGYPWAKHSLALVLALGLGYGVASGIQHWRNTQHSANMLADLLANSAVNQVTAPVARLSAAVIVDGNRIDDTESVALPSNSVFSLRLQADHGGAVTVYAINPQGRSSPVWSGRLQTGQALDTPPMRLQGVRGLETLRMVFKPDEVGDSTPASVVREVQILHV
jgi:hypothetical protein